MFISIKMVNSGYSLIVLYLEYTDVHIITSASEVRTCYIF